MQIQTLSAYLDATTFPTMPVQWEGVTLKRASLTKQQARQVSSASLVTSDVYSFSFQISLDSKPLI